MGAGSHTFLTRFGPLRSRDFRILFAAQTVSVVGDALLPVALAFAVLDLSNSASALGLVLLASFVPRVVLMLVGGVWADRLPRQKIMIASHLLRFASQGAQGWLLVTGRASIESLALLQILRGTCSAFFGPAAAGIVPSLVSRRDLQPANALMWISANLAGIIGPAIAGVLVATVGAGWAVLGDAASFLAAAVLLLFLRLPGRARMAAPASFWRDFAAGWSEVRSRTWVWASIAYFASFQLVYLSSFSVLGPVVSKRSLGGSTAWTTIAVAAAAGALLGSVAALRVRPSRPLLVAFVAGFAAVPSLVLLGIPAPTYAIAAAELVAGGVIGVGTTLWETTLQQGVSGEALSRVSSYDAMGSIALRPIGLALVGPITVAIGVRGALFGAAAIVVCTTAAIVSLPSIRRMRRADAESSAPALQLRADA